MSTVAAYRTYMRKQRKWANPTQASPGEPVELRITKVSSYTNLTVRADVSLQVIRADPDMGTVDPPTIIDTTNRGFRPGVTASYKQKFVFPQPGRYSTQVITQEAGHDPITIPSGQAVDIVAGGAVDVLAWPNWDFYDRQHKGLHEGDTIHQQIIVRNRDNSPVRLLGLILTASSGQRTNPDGSKRPGDPHTHDPAFLDVVWRPKASPPPTVNPATGLFNDGFVDTLAANGGQCAYIVSFTPPEHGLAAITGKPILEGDAEDNNNRRHHTTTAYNIGE